MTILKISETGGEEAKFLRGHLENKFKHFNRSVINGIPVCIVEHKNPKDGHALPSSSACTTWTSTHPKSRHDTLRKP